MHRPKRSSIPVNNLLAWVSLAVLVVTVATYAYSILKSPAKENPEKSPKQKAASGTQKSSSESSRELVGKVRVLASGLNLRSSPQKNRNIIGSLKKGTILSVLSKKDDWYEVETPTGKKGFVSTDLKYIQVMEMREK